MTTSTIFITVRATFDMASHCETEVKSFLKLENAMNYVEEMKAKFLKQVPGNQFDSNSIFEDLTDTYHFNGTCLDGENHLSIDVAEKEFEDYLYENGSLKNTHVILEHNLKKMLTFKNIEEGLDKESRTHLTYIENFACRTEDYRLAHLIRKLLYIQSFTSNGGMPIAKEILAHVAKAEA